MTPAGKVATRIEDPGSSKVQLEPRTPAVFEPRFVVFVGSFCFICVSVI